MKKIHYYSKLFTSLLRRYRFAVADSMAFSTDVVLNCEELLLRVLDLVDELIPSVYETLFRPGESWASRQPLTSDGMPPGLV